MDTEASDISQTWTALLLALQLKVNLENIKRLNTEDRMKETQLLHTALVCCMSMSFGSSCAVRRIGRQVFASIIGQLQLLRPHPVQHLRWVDDR